jgi:hypothetical protein
LSIIHLHPFARGTVHITSSDPFGPPAIDYSALDNHVDVAVLANGIKFARKVLNTQAFKPVFSKEVAPGPEITDQLDIENAVRKQVATTFHPIGTAALLPREENGVVDHNLKVYGTTNLRVVRLFLLAIELENICSTVSSVSGRWLYYPHPNCSPSHGYIVCDCGEGRRRVNIDLDSD